MAQRNAKVITVYPIAGGNGASYLTVQIARELRQVEKYRKIAIVDFDFDAPVLAEGLHEDDVHGIDMLVDKLNGSILTNESFLENMVQLKDDIHLLRGSQLGHRFPFVLQEHLDAIMAKLREEYDYIIVAAGSDATNGGTPSALFHADHVVVVGRFTQKNEWRLKDALATLKAYRQTDAITLVYNLYEGQNKLDFSQRIPKEWTVAGLIDYDASTIDNKPSGLKLAKGKKKENTKETYKKLIATLVTPPEDEVVRL